MLDLAWSSSSREVKIGNAPTWTASKDMLGVTTSIRKGVVTRATPSGPVRCTRAAARMRRHDRSEKDLPLYRPLPKLFTRFLHDVNKKDNK